MNLKLLVKISRLFFVIFLFFTSTQAEAQFLKTIGNKAKKAVERTVERRVEKESSESTEDVLDEVFDNDSPKKKETKSSKNKGSSSNSNTNEPNSNSTNTESDVLVTGSTFFPAGEVIYSEDFSKDAIGDFPAGWDTSSGGEIITINGKKALKLYPDGVYTFNNAALPENYAFEFDLHTQNLIYDGMAGSSFNVSLLPEKTLKKRPNKFTQFEFSLWYKGGGNKINLTRRGTSEDFNNSVSYDIQSHLNNTVKITCVVNGKRLRIYFENEKVVDLPNLLQDNLGRYIQFQLYRTEKNKHTVAISNLKITKEGEDLRSQILKGGFSTTQINFDTGSDQIKSNSYDFLKQLTSTLQQDNSLKIKIIGHTDNVGDDAKNLELSKKRAQSVKNYLVENGINESRIQTSGKGETEPVQSNDSEDGKAQNRRVEFQKI